MIIYSEHFFEHLDYPEDAKHFLRECFRVLEPHGIFRVGVPDTLLALLDYAGVGDGSLLQACKNGEFFHPEWCKTSMDPLIIIFARIANIAMHMTLRQSSMH